MSDNKKGAEKLSCIDCAAGACDGKRGDGYPQFCLTEGENAISQERIKEAVNIYKDNPEDLEISRVSAVVEAEHYLEITRVEEICEFAKKMGYKKLGVATCIGLLAEARAAAKIFRSKGFEVFGISCKAGAVPKTELGMDPICRKPGPNMCNPILQAKTLNAEETDFNVVIGLCVGHDSLFYKYSEAPVTTLVTKDRVLGHNPVAALYQLNSYYSKLLK